MPLQPLASGDLVLENIFLSFPGGPNPGNEVVLTVANVPSGSLSGKFDYQVFANGGLVESLTDVPIPAGSEAFWTGYIVNGDMTIRAVLDPNNKLNETNKSNNVLTKSCSSATHTCS
jgi:subtilase family serine protease